MQLRFNPFSNSDSYLALTFSGAFGMKLRTLTFEKLYSVKMERKRQKDFNSHATNSMMPCALFEITVEHRLYGHILIGCPFIRAF